MSRELLKESVKEPAYTYRAKIVSVYDGDTFTVDIDLGLGVWKCGQKIRLYGVDTPELRGVEREEGLRVRDYVRELCPVGSFVIIRTLRDRTGKYGRWLAVVYIPQEETSVNDLLLMQGKAVPYFL